MNERSGPALGAGLVYEACVALRWARQEQAADPLVIDQHNEQVLQVLTAFDDYHGEPLEESGLTHELARIDRKLNMVLDLVTQLVVAHLELPQPTPVWLESGAIRWRESGALPAVGDRLLLELYLESRYPRPLRLPVLVMSVDADVVKAAFTDLVPGISDWIDKLIFRHHRRQVALARRGSD